MRSIRGTRRLLRWIGNGLLAVMHVPNSVAIDVRDPPRAEQVDRLARELGMTFEGRPETRPPAILNLARITFVPFVLGGLLAVLTVLVVVNSIYLGVRRRDRQVAVLRALGADGPWVVRTALWQAITVTVALILIGAPLGFLAGALAFRVLAEDIGAIPDTAIPIGLTGLVLAALGLLSMLAAAGAGRPSLRNEPAPLLRAG
jgi:putative ABC transport system permease protein